jgi:hypothetical protein
VEIVIRVVVQEPEILIRHPIILQKPTHPTPIREREILLFPIPAMNISALMT